MDAFEPRRTYYFIAYRWQPTYGGDWLLLNTLTDQSPIDWQITRNSTINKDAKVTVMSWQEVELTEAAYNRYRVALQI